MTKVSAKGFCSLRHLCGKHADRFTGSRSVHPHRLWLLARISVKLARKKPIELRLEHGSEGQLIHGYLHRNTLGFQTPLHQAVSVLQIPKRGQPYKHRGLRRKCRKAAARGIVCRFVSDQQERRSLVRLFEEHERHHPDARYRREHPWTSDLNEAGLWLAAYADDQRPLVLSVIPRSGDTAALRFFRTLETSQDATLARYLLTAYMVHELAERGVRHLIDITHPISIPSGLHQFAMALGFEIGRAKLAFNKRPLMPLALTSAGRS